MFKNSPHQFGNPFADMKYLLRTEVTSTIVDGGAYVGPAAIEFQRAFPKAKVLAFEPSKDTWLKLHNNTRYSPLIVPICKALSDDTGSHAFHIMGYEPTHSLLSRPASGTQYFPNHAGAQSQTVVDCVRLDDYCCEHEIDRVNILKLDVQGAELKVLEGARNLLNAGKIDAVFIESTFVPVYEGGALFSEVHAILNAAGFSLFRMYDFGYADNGQLVFCNSLYLSESLRKSVDVDLPTTDRVAVTT